MDNAPSLTFKEFVMRRKAGSDAVGDVLRLAYADPNLPEFGSWQELHAYLTRRHDNPQLTSVAEEVWRKYLVNERQVRNAQRPRSAAGD